MLELVNECSSCYASTEINTEGEGGKDWSWVEFSVFTFCSNRVLNKWMPDGDDGRQPSLAIHDSSNRSL
jgi:hypothetical protein